MCLPGARAQARIHGLSAHGIPEGSTLAMNADTLHVIGDEQRCTVTWRGSFAVTSEAALGAVRIITGVETAGEPISWPDAAELLRMIAASDAAPGAAAAASTSTDGTIPLSSSDVEIVFSSSGDAAGTLALPPETTLPITSSAARAPRAPALPFRAVSIGERSAPALSGSPSPTRVLQGSSGETLPLPDASTPAARPTTLPFGKEPPAPEPPPSPEPVETKAPAPKVVWTRSHEEEEPAPAPAPRPAPPARPAPKVDVKNKLYGPGKKKG
jgi:hypothetical protein